MEHEKSSTRLAIDDAKIIYKEIYRVRSEIDKDKEDIAKNTVELKHLETVIREKNESKKTVENFYLKAKSNLAELDCSKAINEEKQKLAVYEYRGEELEEEKNELSIFQDNVNDMLTRLGIQADNISILRGLEVSGYSSTEKENEINNLKIKVSERKDSLIEQRVLIRNQLKDIQTEINHYNQIIDECNKNKPDYSSVKEHLTLIDEINKEFRKNNIRSEAKFACEYVVEITDEGWREAIEAFLGVHRYSIIVEPRYFEIADNVLDRSSHKNIELVNTKLLAGKTIKCVDDAVLKKLVIKNEIAEKYFAYWLGRIHAVNIADVVKYENAMSKEGKLSRNMAVTFINIKKIRTFCLGQEAIEINKRRAEKQITELEKEEMKFLVEKENKDKSLSLAEGYLGYFKEYNFSAYTDYNTNMKKINETKENLKRLIDAQKNNMEYQTLSKRVQELEDDLSKLRDELDGYNNSKNKLGVENDQHQKNISANGIKLRIKEEGFNEQRLLHPSEVKTAVKEYDNFISGISKDGDVMLHNTRERADRRKRELGGLIIGGQKEYNRRKKEEDRLPEGVGYEGKYLARRNKIWVDDLQDINTKMAEQTKKYESIFKNEFVLSLYQTALSAKEDIAGINKELRKLQFTTKYQFDVNLLDDKSDYAKILRYAEYLKKTNKVDDGQMVFGSLYGYEDDEIETREKEIKEIINRIIDKNDLGVIKAFADYRNYMSYEIIINNADVKDGKLSKQAGYNSGAGTQIPYTLILSAALSMLYNARVNSTRLIFIDEPFEKMSDHNIKLMLEFFKNQNFQVIFCAPPNKTDSIGYECNVIIPVIKLRNDNMQIGSVQFYAEK